MLQRIQSIYLLLIVILSGINFYSPIATLSAESIDYIVSYKGIYSLSAAEGQIFQSAVWGITVFASLIPIIALITVFLFKKRKLQIRLTYVNIGCILMYYASVLAYLYTAVERYGADWSLKYNVILHAVNLILCFLAISAIKKDEALVRSHERLR